MNPFNRFLLIVFGVTGLLSILVLASVIFEIPYISPWVQSFDGTEWFFYTVLSASIFIGFIFLILLLSGLFSPTPEKQIIIQTGEGNIEISRKAIESVALRSVKELSGVRDLLVRATINRKQNAVSIKVSCQVFDQTKLPSLGKQMQERVKESVGSLLEIPVENVEIIIGETKELHKKQTQRVV
ncbi:alkaline shock response membrane anchor protein AmaP [Planococcus sp. ISL-109]|uniref:alkaline shock response membrane anchor protein AmaP n=1 Tax=Planococcus sp. ISL-109 TaxID=2819166 RepID=UPI001BE9041A|nr:alkaline shock response membrane anchor protein AmaP [Planococcus sp. ISL-109]